MRQDWQASLGAILLAIVFTVVGYINRRRAYSNLEKNVGWSFKYFFIPKDQRAERIPKLEERWCYFLALVLFLLAFATLCGII